MTTVKFGGSYRATECSRPNDHPATCALCDKAHSANYRGCEHAPRPKRTPPKAVIPVTQNRSYRSVVGPGGPPPRAGPGEPPRTMDQEDNRQELDQKNHRQVLIRRTTTKCWTRRATTDDNARTDDSATASGHLFDVQQDVGNQHHDTPTAAQWLTRPINQTR